ncbi:UNVERIFIED_CONTAM: hypothetical protein Scaly_1831000 [Sesamum calycinum]|uniref:Uncharacterized protein n=2 Tax=Sesamum TaxID=4181 RepID=A0AAW2ND92_9LAMI
MLGMSLSLKISEGLVVTHGIKFVLFFSPASSVFYADSSNNRAPPATFPRPEKKLKPISLPEDTFVNKFFQKHPDSKFEDAIKYFALVPFASHFLLPYIPWVVVNELEFYASLQPLDLLADSERVDLFLGLRDRISGFDPPAARVFAWRVLELKEQGVSEEEAMAVADMEYRAERKAKKKAYARLKQIARLQGKRPPPNPYPSAIKEIQAEERKFVHDRFNNPQTLQIVNKLRQDRAAEMMDRRGGFFG